VLDVFLEVVLPVAITAGLGGLGARWRRLPADIPSALVFYIFAPALVFHAMATTTVSANDSLKIVLVMLASFAAMYVVAMLWSTFRGHDAPMRMCGFRPVSYATAPRSWNGWSRRTACSSWAPSTRSRAVWWTSSMVARRARSIGAGVAIAGRTRDD
jgi:hypothetical protein